MGVPPHICGILASALKYFENQRWVLKSAHRRTPVAGGGETTAFPAASLVVQKEWWFFTAGQQQL